MTSHAIKLWACTVFFNTGFIFIVSFIMNGIDAFLLSFLILITSGIISSPLVILIRVLVKYYLLLPAHPADKFYWLLFWLMILAGFFLWLLVCLFGIDTGNMPTHIKWIMVSVMVAVALSTYLTKSSLNILNAIYHE